MQPSKRGDMSTDFTCPLCRHHAGLRVSRDERAQAERVRCLYCGIVSLWFPYQRIDQRRGDDSPVALSEPEPMFDEVPVSRPV